jgi:prepilin-type N-terminal cleavage/methylation domain-containing protein
MIHRASKSGFTLIEIMVAVALLGIATFAAFNLFSPIVKFFPRSQARSQAILQARQCMETIDRVMSSGRASTLVLPAVSTVPFSTAQFIGVDQSSYTITLSSSPLNSVHLLRTLPGAALPIDTVLATNVTMLNFLVDLNNPGFVQVTFQMIAPLDSSGSPDSFYTIFLPNQTIVMNSS